MDRRTFLAGAAAAVIHAQRESPAQAEASREPATEVIDAGPISGFRVDGVYDEHRTQGFFLIRQEKKLFALSAICTHKGCKVRAQADGSFICKCHGSSFSPEGIVLNGPAVRNLPRLGVKESADGHVLVNLARKFESTK